MITARAPRDWRGLENAVAAVLRECGFAVEAPKVVRTVRGNVNIDVYAEETVGARTYRFLCECKWWRKHVPKSVIHSFRTVVGDSGANVGYIISAGGFQAGAFSAAELTNVRLVTWEEFQTQFEPTWVENFMLPQVAERFDLLFSYTEPLPPQSIDQLTVEGQERFVGPALQIRSVWVAHDDVHAVCLVGQKWGSGPRIANPRPLQTVRGSKGSPTSRGPPRRSRLPRPPGCRD